MLDGLAAVAADPRVSAALKNPKLSDAQVAGLFISILAGKLNGDAENLVRVPAENGRLELPPLVRDQYAALRNEREGIVEAEVQSAFDLSPAQVTDLVSRLEKKTGRKVRAKLTLRKALIR